MKSKKLKAFILFLVMIFSLNISSCKKENITVDNEKQVVRIVSKGYAPANKSEAQAKLMARKAAIVLAQKDVLEGLEDLEEYKDKIDLVTQSKKEKFLGLLNTLIVTENYYSEKGMYEIVIEVPFKLLEELK